MINKLKGLKIKYNLVLGVFIGFILAQLALAEGYAILVGRQQNNGTLGMEIPEIGENFFKILSVVVFIATVAIFCTKRFREINLNKMGIYLLWVVVIALVAAIQGGLIFVTILFKVIPNIADLVATNYFVSTNFFFLIWFIGIGIFLTVFIFLVNRKVKYIKLITKEVNSIKEEGFGKTIEVKGEDELAQLCDSINTMSIELGQKIENEKRIEKTKSELITNISHDLKTPLTSLVGYLELLNNGNLEEEVKEEYLKIAYNKSLRLKDLVNELFEYTKLTNNNFKIERVEYNISNIINQIVGESILDFLEKDIEVKLENPYKELFYNIDPKLFTRLIENLVNNAEKYSDSKSIFRAIVEDKASTIEITFINKCEELKEYQLEKIFEKFYRLDQARSSDDGGSGLGLSIAKRIVELHNGNLTVEKVEEYIQFKIMLNK